MTEQLTVIALISLAGVCVYILGWLDCRDRHYSRADMNVAILLGYLNAQYKYQNLFKGCIRHDPKTGRFMKAGRG